MNNQKILNDISSVINEINIHPNKNRVSANFRHDDSIDDEIKKVLDKFQALPSAKQNKFLKIVTSKEKMNPKVADDLATQ
jgi:hypothetical protein